MDISTLGTRETKVAGESKKVPHGVWRVVFGLGMISFGAAMMFFAVLSSADATADATPEEVEMYGGRAGEVLVGREGDDFIESSGGGSDTVFCGGGRDVANADDTDEISADCETIYLTIPGHAAR